MVVALQGQVDQQGRKIGDLEDYIDNMLIRILEVAPILLKKPSPVLAKGRHINWAFLSSIIIVIKPNVIDNFQ